MNSVKKNIEQSNTIKSRTKIIINLNRTSGSYVCIDVRENFKPNSRGKKSLLTGQEFFYQRCPLQQDLTVSHLNIQEIFSPLFLFKKNKKTRKTTKNNEKTVFKN